MQSLSVDTQMMGYSAPPVSNNPVTKPRSDSQESRFTEGKEASIHKRKKSHNKDKKKKSSREHRKSGRKSASRGGLSETVHSELNSSQSY